MLCMYLLQERGDGGVPFTALGARERRVSDLSDQRMLEPELLLSLEA
jgi:hypothetical protein